MKSILVFGAGKSATSLIEYLGRSCKKNDWRLVVCDANPELAQVKTAGIENAEAVSIDVTHAGSRTELIKNADIVISMLPASLHILVAYDCIALSKNLLTASYVDDKIKALQADIANKGLLFICEMGLDPGIDHMSAMQLIQQIKEEGGSIHAFTSHCGGLVAPESDDNPWHYKITWNPANVVSAGKAGADFLLDSQRVHVPYEKIFAGENQIIEVDSLPPLAWYANRDSLSYIDLYQLRGVTTFLRTTLRYPAYCRGWNRFIAMGLTNADDVHEVAGFATIDAWFRSKAAGFQTFFDNEFRQQVEYLGLTSSEPVPSACTSSALILQNSLETRLKMMPHDKDMIVMVHEVEYTLNGGKRKAESVLIVKGDDQHHTAMSKTVGLPLGIAAELILKGEITITGLHIPILPQIYIPVLNELKLYGIEFMEKDELIA